MRVVRNGSGAAAPVLLGALSIDVAGFCLHAI
jgi:hypothetical protein